MSFKDHVDVISRFAKEDLARVKPSFAEAYTNGHYHELGIKSAGVAMGAVLTAKGVQQFVKGGTERIRGTQDPSKQQPNYTRMFVGGFTAFTGAALLYLAACKGILSARSL